MNKLRPEAERLRRAGYSYAMIEEELGIARSTMSYWFKDQPFTPNQKAVKRIKLGSEKVGKRRHSERVKETELLKRKGIKQVGTLSNRDIWMLGLGIYIGEGAKSIEAIRISNSDPAVIRIAMRWLRDMFGLEDSNFMLRLHLYPDSNVGCCLTYWQGVTGLKKKNFYRSSIDRRTNKKATIRKLAYGTAHLSVVSNGDPSKGVKLFRLMAGWMTGAINQV